jgi:hypothetical protein
LPGDAGKSSRFFESFRPKQAFVMHMAAGQSNFDCNPSQLDKTKGTFLLFGKTGDLSTTTGHPMLDIRPFRRQNR